MSTLCAMWLGCNVDNIVMWSDIYDAIHFTLVGSNLKHNLIFRLLIVLYFRTLFCTTSEQRNLGAARRLLQSAMLGYKNLFLLFLAVFRYQACMSFTLRLLKC